MNIMDFFMIFLVVTVKIHFLNAEDVDTSTTIKPIEEIAANNKTSADSKTNGTAVESRFYDFGFPNYQRPYENSPNNYPGDGYGNQNYNNQRPQQGYGWQPDSQWPNQGRPQQQGQQSYPGNYQGNNPGNNYPGSYPNNYPGNYPNNYPANNPNNYPGNNPNNYPGKYPNNYQNNYPNNYPNGYPSKQDNAQYQRGPSYNDNFKPEAKQNPNYQQPLYSNAPNDGIQYPSETERPYENGGAPSNYDNYPNQPINSANPNGYPNQNIQYPPQENSNVKPGDYPELKPDDIGSTIQFPGNEIRPNQYPANNNPKYNYASNQNVNQVPYQNALNSAQTSESPASNQVFQGNLNDAPSNISQTPNIPPIDSINSQNANGPVAIPGKPGVDSALNLPNNQGIYYGSKSNGKKKKDKKSHKKRPKGCKDSHEHTDKESNDEIDNKLIFLKAENNDTAQEILPKHSTKKHGHKHQNIDVDK